MQMHLKSTQLYKTPTTTKLIQSSSKKVLKGACKVFLTFIPSLTKDSFHFPKNDVSLSPEGFRSAVSGGDVLPEPPVAPPASS